MDALELLEEDHKLVMELFKKAGEAQDEKEKRKIFREIYKELETHARIEETVFYPAMQENEELKHMVLEALEEHKQVKALLREIKNLKPGSEKFEPKLQVLLDNVGIMRRRRKREKCFRRLGKSCRGNSQGWAKNWKRQRANVSERQAEARLRQTNLGAIACGGLT